MPEVERHPISTYPALILIWFHSRNPTRIGFRLVRYQ